MRIHTTPKEKNRRVSLSQKQGQAWYYLEDDPEVMEVFYGGAAGGGKTWLGCLWQIYRRLKYPGSRGCIARNRYKDLKDTTLMTFMEVANSYFDMIPERDYRYYEQKGRITFPNGSAIFLRDLKYQPSDPNFHDLGSLELTDAFIDEVPEVTKKAVDILTSRIRYNLPGGVRKLLATGNPENNWAKKRWVLDENNRPVKLKPHQRYIRATLDDNPDKSFKDTYRQNLQDLDPYDRARLLMGDWTVQMNESPFFPSFIDDQISKDLEINNEEPVWLSFDFNIDPTTVIIGQMIWGEGCYIYDIIQTKGGTEKLCDVLLNSIDYPEMGLIITGDHSGHSGSTSAGVLPGGQYNTDFEIIKEKLAVGNSSLRNTQTANSKHEHSYRLCDSFLRHIPFKVNSRCTQLINDLRIAQRTEKGSLRKDRDNFKMDAADAFRYMVHAWFKSRHKEIMKFKQSI